MSKQANLKNLLKAVIDEESYGKDKMLKSMFFEMWNRFFTKIPEISFEKIGKKSKKSPQHLLFDDEGNLIKPQIVICH